MLLPDATAPALGTHFADGCPNATPERPGAASSHLPDSDHVRGMDATADSISYDTDMDVHAAFSQPAKSWLPASLPAKPEVAWSFPLCPPLRGFTVDGVGPPPPPRQSLTCAHVMRNLALLAQHALLWIHNAAFKPPGTAEGGASPAALLSLVSRQVYVGLPTWDSHQQELADREAWGRGAPRRSLLGLPMLHPLCGAALGWSSAMLLFDLVFTAFWVPVNVAFCLDQYGRLEAACTRTDLAGGIIYLVNLLISFQVGVTLTCGYRSRVVLDGRDAARLYASTLSFWLDVLAVAPFAYLLVILGMGDSIGRHQTVSIVSLMRLVRLFRVASIIKQMYSSSSGGELQSSWVADHFSVTPIYMALLMYLAMVLVNLYSCLLLLIAHYEQRRGKTSWMASVTWQHVAARGAALRWYNAVYFSITVMTTTGYADFLPKSPMEQVVVSVMMLNGLLIFGAVVALIGSALRRSTETAQRLHDDRKQLTNLRQWLQEGEVDERVCRDVITFFAELSARRDGGRTESDIVFELPSHLRQKVSRHVVKGLLERCPPLRGLPDEVRELLASHCVPLELPTDHDLFRLGDDVEGEGEGGGGGGMWLLEEGVVCAHRKKEREEMPSDLAVPCLLGEGAILADIIPACSARMWTLRTERPCRIWQLREPALRAALQIYPSVTAHLMLYVRDQILAWLSGQEEREEEGWCELVQLLKRSFITGPLRDRSQDCYLALQLASLQDGTLTQLLAAWLEMSTSCDMTLKDPLDTADVNFGAAGSWPSRAAAAAAAAASHVRLITPAVTPEQFPVTPEPSVAAGRAFHAATAGSQSPHTGRANPPPTPPAFDHHSLATLAAGFGDGAVGTSGSGMCVDLPMPPPAAMMATEAEVAAAPPPPPPQLPSGQLSNSGLLPSVPTLTPAVGQAIFCIEPVRRSRSRSSSSSSDGGSGGGGGALSEGGTAPRSALRRAYSNSTSGATAAAAAVTAAAYGPPLSVLAAADAPRGTDRMRASAPNLTFELAAAAPPPPPAQTPAANLSPLTALAASRSLFGGVPPFVDGAAAAQPPPAGLVVAGGGGGGPLQTPAAAPTHAASSRLPRMGSYDSGGSPHAGGKSAHWDGDGSASRWLAVPPEAALAGGRWPSSAAAAGPSLPRPSTPGWRRASFDAGSGGGGGSGQHVLVRPTSPGPMSPPASPRYVWYGSSGAAAAAAAVRVTPMSPLGPGGYSHEFEAAVTAAVAAGTASPAPSGAPPQAAATELVRQVSTGRSTFIQKIFLAAGVKLQPQGRPSEVPVAGTAGTTAHTAGPFQPQGPTILAPACAFCGCATCAYCARPIVPQGAAAAVRQLEPSARSDPAAAAGGSGGGAAADASGLHLAPPPSGSGVSEAPAALRATSGSRGASFSHQAGTSRQASGVSFGGGVSRQGSGALHLASGEYAGLASGTSATRLPPMAPALTTSSPRSPVGRLRPDRGALGASSLSRGAGGGIQKVHPQLTAYPSAPTRLRSGSGINGVWGCGGGGGRTRLGLGEASRGGSGLVTIRSGDVRSGGGGSGAALSPGAALAAAAAAVSGQVEMAAAADEGEAAAEAAEGRRRSRAEELLPLSGTMRLI
ncbi:hypothetical protein PLESTB_001002700 [Pleodorina starrii]|uniref:Cyclic nucleotide-binding domain-containing protein n=1 Tax=Pleodorina starrii TaxID=330485 RepID=A0A9W6BPK5_9CHLO|nr:hypothetical protein PLESTM_001204800 [Pleodorina starrii]GLC55580.1 hypothetical protein PLESTB_001002700 [Pleodorina starrii]